MHISLAHILDGLLTRLDHCLERGDRGQHRAWVSYSDVTASPPPMAKGLPGHIGVC